MAKLLVILTLVGLAEGRESRRQCKFFNGESMSCEQLDRAIKFNQQEMPRLRAASYDSVRKKMTEYGLFGDSWHVGHACPDPSKSSKRDDEDFGWNLFAQAASDNIRLGHCLVSCAEAEHFGGDVPCSKSGGCRECTSKEKKKAKAAAEL